MNTADRARRSVFDGIAAAYDWESAGLSVGGIRAWHHAAIAVLHIAPGDNVLDVGCGTGVVLRECAERMDGRGTFVGLDASSAMLEVAQQHSRTAAHAAIRWMKGDGQALPFADASFDWVTAQFSLRNMEDWRRGLREMIRVLKPGGSLVLLDLVHPRSLFGRLSRFYVRLVTRLPGLGAYRQIYLSLSGFATDQQLLTAMEANLAVHAVRRWAGGLVLLAVAVKKGQITAPRA